MTFMPPRLSAAPVLLALTFVVGPSAAASESANDGFTPLFNGRDLTGWHTLPGGTWGVKDGAILGTSPASESKHGMLVTDKTYRNFVLQASFKVVRGNSGLYFRCEKKTNATGVAGFQAEVDNSKDVGGVCETGVRLEPRPGESGWKRYHHYITTDRPYGNFILDLEFKYEKKGNTGVFLRIGDPKNHVESGFEAQILDSFGKDPVGAHDCGGIIKTAAPSKIMARPTGEWNRYVITCVGSRFQVEFKGERAIELDLSTSTMKDRQLRGLIGFQDEGKPVWYRNVRIVELPDSI